MLNKRSILIASATLVAGLLTAYTDATPLVGMTCEVHTFSECQMDCLSQVKWVASSAKWCNDGPDTATCIPKDVVCGQQITYQHSGCTGQIIDIRDVTTQGC
jgi:hypothetical protein